MDYASWNNEDLLLRDDWFTGEANQEMWGVVELQQGNRVYTLRSRFTPSAAIGHAFSAHTIKQLYLTSHLYVFFEPIPPGESRTLVVRNELSVDVQTAVTPVSWGRVKERYLGPLEGAMGERSPNPLMEKRRD